MWVAAESGDLAVALIPAVWAFLGVVVVTLGTVFVQAMKGRSEDKSSPPANGHAATALLQVARDVAHDLGQLDQRANDSDARDEAQDRRLDAIERHLDTKNADWRKR